MHPDDARRVLGDGADVVICGPGTAGALQTAVEMAAPGGTVVMFTPFPPEVPVTFDSQRFYFGDLRVVGELFVRARRHPRLAGDDRAGHRDGRKGRRDAGFP